MKDATGRELTVGDLIMLHQTGSNNYFRIDFGILKGGATKGGKPYYIDSRGNKAHAPSGQIIKVTPEMIREMQDENGAIKCNPWYTKPVNEINFLLNLYENQ